MPTYARRIEKSYQKNYGRMVSRGDIPRPVYQRTDADIALRASWGNGWTRREIRPLFDLGFFIECLGYDMRHDFPTLWVGVVINGVKVPGQLFAHKGQPGYWPYSVTVELGPCGCSSTSGGDSPEQAVKRLEEFSGQAHETPCHAAERTAALFKR